MERHWRLNERHYGALQGLNKAETAKKFGDEQVLVWRRSYDTPPSALEPSDLRSERSDHASCDTGIRGQHYADAGRSGTRAVEGRHYV